VPSPSIPLPREREVSPFSLGKSEGFDDPIKIINYHQKGRG